MFDLLFRFEPKFHFAIGRATRLLPELVRARWHLTAPHHAKQLPLQLLSEVPETLDSGFVFDKRRRSRCEFDLVLYTFSARPPQTPSCERARFAARAAQNSKSF
ncbi:hypothetical protein ACVWZZ_002099 [Bradyrhizobium sp. LM6.10]